MKTISELNSDLREVYSSLDIFKAVDDYNKNVENETEKSAYPLFIKANEDYEKADIKLMIFGQETNGWGLTYGSVVAADEVTNEYDKFFNTKYCYTHDGTKEYPKIDYLWNNIVKLECDKENFPDPHENHDPLYDNIVQPHLNKLINEEIKILKPNYIIFFTGKNYDSVLNDVFNMPEKKSVEGFDDDKLYLCEFIIPGIKKAFRTNARLSGLKQERQRNVDKCINKIIEEITSDIQLR